MQWRMVGRRGRGATWTIVGDLAQSSWPVPAESAAARAEALGDKPRHDFHLSTNYRNSAEIYEFAAEYAGRAGLDADLPDAVRSTGVQPAELRVDDLESAVHEHLVRARRLAGGHDRRRGADRAPRRGQPLGLVLARARRRDRRPGLPDRRTHRAGHQGPRVRRRSSWCSRRRSRTRPRPAGPRSTSSTPAPPSAWSPSPPRTPA